MRLINTRTFLIEEFTGQNIPRYAILSHTWGEDEVSYEDYVSGNTRNQKGYDKLQMTCIIAAREGIQYAWADTCCIDKRSSAELTEAINSMYLWYQKSVVCYVYLSDLSEDADLNEALKYCRWFTRGWTLQELIAPRQIRFYDSDWYDRGTKQSLARHISEITRIDNLLLQGKVPLSGFSVAQRMSWAAPRQTTRKEDLAYCLFGIFDLNLPLLYGEGKRAFRRLQQEIIRTTLDLSIFAWHLLPVDQDDGPMSDAELRHIFNPTTNDLVLSGVLAESPAEFYPCVNYTSNSEDFFLDDITMTNIGVKIRTRLLTSRALNIKERGYVLPLGCKSGSQWLGIFLRQVGHQQYLRADPRRILCYPLSDLGWPIYTIAKGERHLLLKLPEKSGYQDFRLGHASRVIPQIRSQVLKFSTTPYIRFIEPWPPSAYDQQDSLFCVTPSSGKDFACLRIQAKVPFMGRGGTKGTFFFLAWLCAVRWSSEARAHFSVVACSPENDAAVNRFFSMASDLDYHTGQIESLLETCLIPQAYEAHCPIVNTGLVALVRIHPHFVQDWNVCRNKFWRIKVTYRFLPMGSLPPPKFYNWYMTVDQPIQSGDHYITSFA